MCIAHNDKGRHVLTPASLETTERTVDQLLYTVEEHGNRLRYFFRNIVVANLYV